VNEKGQMNTQSTNLSEICINSADADKLRDTFGGQSRSPNIVLFHMLGVVSYCAVVTSSLRHAVFTIFDFKNCRDLQMGVKGHSRSSLVV